MKNRKVEFAKSLLLVAVFALFSSQALAAKPFKFKLKDLDGAVHETSDYRHRWVILNLWATWCGPCRAEMPELQHFANTNTEVTVIGVNFEHGATNEELRAFLKKVGVSFTVTPVDMDDPPGEFSDIRVLPTTFLIAPDGTLARRFVGSVTTGLLQAAMNEWPGDKPH